MRSRTLNLATLNPAALNPAALNLVAPTLAALTLLLMATASGGQVEPQSSVEPAQPEEQVPAEATVATVEGAAISADAVRRAMVRRTNAVAEGNRELTAREAAVEELVRLEVLARAAREEQLHEQAEIRTAIQQMLAERYWRQIAERVVVEPATDEAIAAFYDEHTARFAEPLRLRGRVLTLRSTGPKGAEALARAGDLAQQAARLDEAGFERLVRQHSEDPYTKRRGGDLGWLSEGSSVFRYPPEVVDALFGLEATGDLSPVVESERGVHLVLRTASQGGETLPLEVAAGEIRRELEQDRRQQALDQEYAALRERFEIEIDRELLERIGPSDLADAARPPSFPVGDPK